MCKECNQVTLYHAADVPLLALQHRNLKYKETNASLRRSLEQRSVQPTLAPKTTGILDFMDDSDDEEEIMQVDKPKSSVASELENSLDCRDVATDPLEFG